MSDTPPHQPDFSAASAHDAAVAADAGRAARLQRLVAALSRAPTPDEVAAAALRESAGALGADAGFVALLDEAGQELRLLHTLGIPPGVLDGLRSIPADADVPAARAVRDGRTFKVASREEAVRLFPHLVPIRDALGTRVSLAIPLPGPEGPVGVLALSFSEPRPIAEEERELVETLAEQCGQALDRARLFAAERTLRERAERLQAVTAALSAAETRAEVTAILIRAQRDAMGAAAASVWLADDEEAPLRLAKAEGYEAAVVSQWPSVRRDDATPLGRAARTREPVFLEGMEDWERFPEVVAEHRRMGWESAAVLPLRAGERLLGVLGCSWARPRRFTPQDRDFMATLAGVCAQALERATLHSELVRSRDEARFLAEASRALASAREPEEALDAVAAMAVPGFADWCAVDLLQPGGAIARVATRHHDEARVAWSRGVLDAVAPRLEDEGGIGAVVRTGEAAFLPEVTDEVLRAAAPSPRHLRVWREMGMRSAITVPLEARGRVLGALTFIAAESGRRYTEADLALARDLAGRVALALDNARLLRAADAARDEAQRASAAKTQFLAVMSHELRTPLNAILGYGDLLEGEVSGPVTDGQRQQLGRIRAAGEQLLELIDQILSLSRIEAGREELRAQAVDLRELAADTAGLVEPAALRKGLPIRVRRPRAPLPLSTDVGKVRQILLNLLSNALKFTDQGWVEVRVARTRTGARVEVTDTGAGIEEGERERIFEPFVQADGSATRRHGGTGLGLAVSRQLARLLGGELTLRSRVGEGSTFILTLPEAPPADGETGPEGGTGEPAR